MVSRIKQSTENLFAFDDMEAEASKHGRQSTPENAEKVTGESLERLRRAQNGRCYYTGKVLTKKNVSIDHRQPLTKGGKHVMSNVALCVKEVNRMKGQLTELEFMELCRRVATH
jgi:CRISPR/Cas system Type II protein with McrA/HNH and RuvC-like nuclease domain